MKPFTSLCPKLVFTVVLFAGGFAMAQDDVQDSQKEQEEELIGGYLELHTTLHTLFEHSCPFCFPLAVSGSL